MISFDVYTGNRPNNLPLGTHVVTHLVEPDFNRRHHVYFDNYFTSVQLMEILQRNKTSLIDTVSKDRRELPVSLKTVKFEFWRKVENGEDDDGNLARKEMPSKCPHDWKQDREPEAPTPRQIWTTSNAQSQANQHPRLHGKLQCCGQERSTSLILWDCEQSQQMVEIFFSVFCGTSAWWMRSFCTKKHLEVPAPAPCRISISIWMWPRVSSSFSSRKRNSAVLSPDGPAIKVPFVHNPTKIKTARGQKNCTLCLKEGRLTARGKKIQTAFECSRCGVALYKDRECFASFHNYGNWDYSSHMAWNFLSWKWLIGTCDLLVACQYQALFFMWSGYCLEFSWMWPVISIDIN